MSAQTYASENDPYFLSTRGVNSISFNKQANPPLAYFDKGILYELTDGVLYFNGVPLSGGGGGSGDVNGPSSSDDNAISRFDSTTGKIIQNSNIQILDGDPDLIEVNGVIGIQSLPLMRFTDSTQKTAIGLRTPINSALGIGSTCVGHGAMQLSSGSTNCTALGADALYDCSGINNIGIGAASGLQYSGTESNNIVIDSPGVVGDNQTIRIGDSQTKCFIKGIYQSTGAGASEVVTVDTDGQLSSTVITPGLSYGTADYGTLLVYKSPTELATTFLSYQNPGGISPNLSLPSLPSNPFINCITNHSAYLGMYNGGNFSGSFNTSVGGSSMSAHTLGGSNTSIGSFSLFNKTTGDSNTSLGSNCLQNLLTGNNNIGLGVSAGNSYTSNESNNIIIGNSGVINDSGAIRIGTNTQDKCFISREFKSNNQTLRIGNLAGNSMSDTNSTSGNVLVGNQTCTSIVSQTGITAVGAFAGRYHTGQQTVAVGYGALSNGSGQNMVVMGFNACGGTTTSSGTVGIGSQCGSSLTSGINNTIIGNSAGGVLATGSGNIYIGNAVNASAANEANTIRIGSGTTRAFISGISGVTTGGAAVACLVDANGQLGTISSSREVKENIRPVEDTSFLHNLNVVNFEYINGSCCEETGLKQKQIGVIAEEVELLKPELVICQQNGIKTVDYQYLFMSAIKEVQKLSKELSIIKAEVDLLKLKI